MCACREPYTWKKWFKEFSEHPSRIRSKFFREVFYIDLIAPHICKFRGHTPVIASGCDNEVACARCKRFLPH